MAGRGTGGTGRGTLVYSTEGGRPCPGCGRPLAACACRQPDAPAPGRPSPKLVATIRLEKKGRGGKAVTVVDGLPPDPARIADLAKAMKGALGTGGSLLERGFELQGDVRDRLRPLLAARGVRVKG